LILVGSKLFLCSCALSNYVFRCYRVWWYSFLSSINCFLSTYAIFLLSSLDYNKDTFFKFINSKFIKKFSFSFFYLVSAFIWLSKASCCFLWKNNAFVHFLFMVSQNLAVCFKFYNFSSYDFSCAVLPLNSSFSSCSFLISTLFFYSTSALFFFHISTFFYTPYRFLSPYPIPLVTLPSPSPHNQFVF